MWRDIDGDCNGAVFSYFTASLVTRWAPEFFQVVYVPFDFCLVLFLLDVSVGAFSDISKTVMIGRDLSYSFLKCLD